MTMEIVLNQRCHKVYLWEAFWHQYYSIKLIVSFYTELYRTCYGAFVLETQISEEVELELDHSFYYPTVKSIITKDVQYNWLYI